MNPSEYERIYDFIEWLLDEWQQDAVTEMCMMVTDEFAWALTEENPYKRMSHMQAKKRLLEINTQIINAILPDMVDKAFDYAHGRILSRNRTLDSLFRFGTTFEQTEAYQRQNAKDQFGRMIYGIVMNDKQFRTIGDTFANIVTMGEMQNLRSREDVQRVLRQTSINIGEHGISAYNPDDKQIINVTAKAKEVVGYSIEQLTQANAQTIGEMYDTDYVEVTAHYGARPTHAVWQGKVYKIHGEAKGYPNLYTATGLGTITGLKGINCRHDYFPFIIGRSVREYTDAELEAMLPENNKFTWQGKEYDGYTATQKQRAFERKLRGLKERLVVLRTFDLKGDFYTTAIKYRQTLKEYNEFSLVAKLPPQVDRYQVPSYDTEVNTDVYKILRKGIA